MKKARTILSLFIALLGIAHIAFTPFIYSGCGLDAQWFATAGFALIFAGFANYLTIDRKESWLRVCGAIADFGLLTILTMVAITMPGAPQAWLGVALALGLFVTIAIDGGKSPVSPDNEDKA